MDNTIERIKKEIKDWQADIHDNEYDADKFDFVFDRILEIIDEELAKEPQEEPNIPLECVDGSCPIALSEEYEEWGMDVVHSYAECPYQPQVQPIVRTPEEVTEMLNKISCTECDKNSSHCHFSEKDCKNYWFEWLTKKEV